MGKTSGYKRFGKVKILIVIVFLLLVTSSITLFQSNTLFPQKQVETNPISTNDIFESGAEYPNILNSVSELQEVKDFKNLVESNNESKLGMSIADVPDIGKPFFTVKVYESFPDHDIVFNWYRVTVEGQISKQDLSATDKWDVIQAKTISLIPEPSPKTVIVEKEVPVQCPITQGKYDADLKTKNDQITQMQQTINYLSQETQRLSGEVFRLQGRVNMLNGY